MAGNEDESRTKSRHWIRMWRGAETKLQQDGDEAEEKVFRTLDLQRHGDEGSLVPASHGTIDFGPGTFDTLLEQLMRENMVLLLAESGGAAGAITHFIEAYREGFQQKPATAQELIELYAVALAVAPP